MFFNLAACWTDIILHCGDFTTCMFLTIEEETLKPLKHQIWFILLSSCVLLIRASISILHPQHFCFSTFTVVCSSFDVDDTKKNCSFYNEILQSFVDPESKPMYFIFHPWTEFTPWSVWHFTFKIISGICCKEINYINNSYNSILNVFFIEWLINKTRGRITLLSCKKVLKWTSAVLFSKVLN